MFFSHPAHKKNVEFVDLVKRFPTVLWLLKLVSIQPRTDCSKFDSEKRKYNVLRLVFYSLLTPEEYRAEGKQRQHAQARPGVGRGAATAKVGV